MIKKKKSSPRLTFLTRCRLCWKITGAVFLIIIIVESLLLIPIRAQYKQELFLQSKIRSQEVIKTLIQLSNPSTKREELQLRWNRVKHLTSIKGFAIYSPKGELLTRFGPPLSLTLAELQNTHLRTLAHISKDGYFLYAYFPKTVLNAEYQVLVLLETTMIYGKLMRFTQSYFIASFLIAFIVTFLTMLMVGLVVLAPILKLRKVLLTAIRNPAKEILDISPSEGMDELSEVRVITQKLLRKIRHQLTQLSAQRKELQKLNNTLEQKVAERTERLENKTKDLQKAITLRKLAEAETASMALFPQQAPNPVIRIDADGKLLYANDRAKIFLKHWEIGTDKLIPEKWQGVIKDALKLGEVKEVEEQIGEATYLLFITPVKQYHYVNIYGSNITTRKQYEKQLAHLSSHDAATNFPNRRLFTDLLEQLIITSKHHQHPAVVLYFSIHDFSKILARLENTIADELLLMIAKRVRHALPDTVIVARMSESDFAAASGELNTPNEANQLAKQILKTFSKPFQVQTETITLTTNIGIAFAMKDELIEATQLIKNADLAMYHAKSIKKNSYQFFIEAMNEDLEETTEIVAALQNALAKNEFSLLFQPQHRLGDGKLVGAESLLRWNNEKFKSLSTDRFIQLLEEGELIFAVTEWIIHEVCTYSLSWKKLQLESIKIAINLSAVQFIHHADIIGIFKDVITQTHINPERIEVEITERIFIEDAKLAIATMQGLRALGLQIALDDFGSDYSSLKYLQQFPVERIKIDKSFIDEINKSQQANTIIKAIITLAHSLSLTVIAEGVETRDQVNFLTQAGCDEVQGYYFSKPLTADDFVLYAQKHLT